MRKFRIRARQLLLLIFACVFLIIFSCKNSVTENRRLVEKEKVYAPPTIISLDTMPAPVVVELKNVAPPVVTPVLQPNSNPKIVWNGKTQIRLFPPKVNDASAPMAHFTNFDVKDGMTINAIWSVFEDSKNRIWAGNGGGGADCLDGNSITSFGFKDGLTSTVRCIAEDRSGDLWFGCENGVAKFDGIKFITYTTKDGLPDNLAFDMKVDKKGNLWIATYGGVCRLDSNGFTTINKSNGLPENNVNSIAFDSKGNVWFMTFGGGITRYDGQNLQTYSTHDGLPTNYMLSGFEDSKGTMWFGSYEAGLCRFDGSQFKTFTVADGLPDNTISDIEQDLDGDLWLATQGGASKMSGEKFSNITVDQGLAGNNVRTILKDHSGYLWFATIGNGLSRYNGKAFKFFTSKQGIPAGMPWNITEDKDGNIWMSPYMNGISKFDGERFVSYTTEQGLLSNDVGGLFADHKGNIWICSKPAGLAKFDGRTFTTYNKRQGLADDGVLSATEDRDGNIWVATNEGISCIAEKTVTTYTALQGLPENATSKIFQDKTGNIWVGTISNGVSRFDGKKFVNYNTKNGLLSDQIADITEDKKGNIWIATHSGGISRFDGKTFLNFSTTQGLPDDVTYFIGQDNDGIIWVGTNQGFCNLKFKIVDGDGKNKAAVGAGQIEKNNDELKNYEPVWEIFNLKTGYPVPDMMDRSFVASKKGLGGTDTRGAGIIWVNSGDGKVILLDSKAVIRNSKPLNPIIQSVRLNDRPINWHMFNRKNFDSAAVVQHESAVFGKMLTQKERDSISSEYSDIKFSGVAPFFQVPNELELPYTHNRIGLEFGAIQTADYRLVRYQYMLEGLDKKWGPITNKRTADYDNLHEGTYAFHVKARNAQGIWSVPVIYKFRVLPPWYRNWWAYALYAAATIISISAFVRWRISSIKKENKQLEQKVEQRTHELNEAKSKVEHSLTELKATQAQLIQSEKMASLGELTAGIAHEIQNPLNFVNNFSDINKDLLTEINEEIGKGNFDEARTLVKDAMDNEEKINHHGKRAESIVKGMLQHSSKSSGQKELVDINNLADEYLRLAFHGFRAKDKAFNATIKTEFDPPVGKLKIVPQDIGRVMLNLVNNAFYAVNEKQKLNPPGYEPTVTVSTKKLANKVEISVTDNGNGIPKNIVDKIFQPFFTTKPTGQGTGLGLSLAYDIITKGHGGELIVQSIEGNGAIFTILLPT